MSWNEIGWVVRSAFDPTYMLACSICDERHIDLPFPFECRSDSTVGEGCFILIMKLSLPSHPTALDATPPHLDPQTSNPDADAGHNAQTATDEITNNPTSTDVTRLVIMHTENQELRVSATTLACSLKVALAARDQAEARAKELQSELDSSERKHEEFVSALDKLHHDHGRKKRKADEAAAEAAAAQKLRRDHNLTEEYRKEVERHVRMNRPGICSELWLGSDSDQE